MRCGGYAFHVYAHFIVGTIPPIFYAPYSSGAMLQRGETPPRAALLLCGLLRTDQLSSPSEYSAPRSTVSPVLRYEPAEREQLPYGSMALVGLLCGSCGVSSEARETRAASRVGLLLICVRTPHPTREAARQNDIGAGKEGRAILSTPYL